MAPRGIYARVPMVDVDGRYSLVDLAYSDPRGPLWLVLAKDPEDTHESGIPFYYPRCQHTRIVIPSPVCTFSNVQWRWQEVYISSRLKARTNPLDPLNAISQLCAGISPPFRIKISTLLAFEQQYDWHLASPLVSLSRGRWSLKEYWEERTVPSVAGFPEAAMFGCRGCLCGRRNERALGASADRR